MMADIINLYYYFKVYVISASLSAPNKSASGSNKFSVEKKTTKKLVSTFDMWKITLLFKRGKIKTHVCKSKKKKWFV